MGRLTVRVRPQMNKRDEHTSTLVGSLKDYGKGKIKSSMLFAVQTDSNIRLLSDQLLPSEVSAKV